MKLLGILLVIALVSIALLFVALWCVFLYGACLGGTLPVGLVLGILLQA